MANQAKVSSLDALESLRAHLIVFLSRGGRSVDEATDAVRRTRYWLENDQRMHWESQLRQRRKILDLAEQELFSAKLSALKETSARMEEAVRKAKRAVAEAEEKLRNTKIWARNFEGTVEPLVKGLDSLRYSLDYTLPTAVAYLSEVQKTLEGYTEIRASDPTPEAQP